MHICPPLEKPMLAAMFTEGAEGVWQHVVKVTRFKYFLQKCAFFGSFKKLVDFLIEYILKQCQKGFRGLCFQVAASRNCLTAYFDWFGHLQTKNEEFYSYLCYFKKWTNRNIALINLTMWVSHFYVIFVVFESVQIVKYHQGDVFMHIFNKLNRK